MKKLFQVIGRTKTNQDVELAISGFYQFGA